MENKMITGKCFCGGIQYKIEANILKSGICHCRDCQRLSSGKAWPFIVIPQESLVIQGKTKEFTRPGASGKPVHVSFCGTCGSTLLEHQDTRSHVQLSRIWRHCTQLSVDLSIWAGTRTTSYLAHSQPSKQQRQASDLG